MKKTKQILSVLLAMLMLLMAAPVGSLASADPAYPDWAFDYTEKDGTVHHKGDAVTTKADHIKNSALSLLYSGEGLNALFESMYADEGSVFTDALWDDEDPFNIEVAYLYVQGFPRLIEQAFPLEPMMFLRYDQSRLSWYRFFDGSYLRFAYSNVLGALSAAGRLKDKAALWSATLLGKHTTDLSLWRVPDTVPVTGTTAFVPEQHSRTSWPSNGDMVNAFSVDTVNDVVDWSLMKDDPQATWQLDANHPETLYSALAACFCGYASAISAALSGNDVHIDNDSYIGSTALDVVIRSASEAGAFYTKLLQPLYEALGIMAYPTLDRLAADAAVGQMAGSEYSFSVNYGRTLFADIMAPIVDWVETVLFADPVNVLADIAPALHNLFDVNNGNSIWREKAVTIRILDTNIHSIGYQNIFARALGLLDLDSALDTFLQCAAQGHVWDGGVIATPGTCITPGTDLFTCTRCGATKTESTTLDAANHVGLTDMPATNPTQNAHGYTAGVWCSECDVWISGHDVIHNPAAAVRENEAAATCTAAGGYDAVVYCTVCPEEISRNHVTVPAAGHAWGEWTVTKQPTCTAQGQQTRTCSRDASHSETQPIAKKPHTDNGNGYCRDCGADLKAGDRCEYCGEIHTGPFGWLIKLLHLILSWF